MPDKIPLIDLDRQRRRLGEGLEAAIRQVLQHGAYIMGPEVSRLEEALAVRADVDHVVSCSSGTDALMLVLAARGVGPGDAVFVPSFTFAATAEVVALLGATPVFVDVLGDTFNMDPASLERALGVARDAGLRSAAIVPVDLFGQPADYAELRAAAPGVFVLADAAQSLGGSAHGQPVGGLGDATTTSFFPAKPLGCYGDGGAVFTNDAELADVVASLRVHGKGSDKYDNVRIGMNARLDTLQAAILLEKLRIFDDEIAARQLVAKRYDDNLAQDMITPFVRPGIVSAWAQYTVLVRDRDAVAARLADAGVSTAIYYPKPLHTQTAYRRFPIAGGGLPVSERLSEQVLSLPMHPYLDEDTQVRVVTALLRALR